jgi:isopenicillin N synthase-like dioxygenase
VIQRDERKRAMAAPDFSTIPVIDVTALRAGTAPERAAVAAELGKAAREVGFMYVAGTGVPERLVQDLQAASERFFGLPLAEKMKVYIGHSGNHRGYVPEGEEVFAGGGKDRKEAYDLAADLPADDPDYLAGNPLLGPNQWPDLPGFAAAVTAYYDAVLELGRLVLSGFALALEKPADFFDAQVTKPPSQLRLIHYPYAPDAEDRLGIGAHTDYECFTLLKPTAPGLEVLNGAGDWIDAPPIPGTFVVNIGDMLELWTNGEFVATTHRVRTVSQERYSYPLFFSVDYHTVVAPLAEFVTPDRPPVRPTLVAGEHLFAQTAQSFTYLKNRVADGGLILPEGSLALSSFGHTAPAGP